MTIKELYEFAKKEGIEDIPLFVQRGNNVEELDGVISTTYADVFDLYAVEQGIYPDADILLVQN